MSGELAIYAAGAVCWRVGGSGSVKVLLVDRPGHNDISLPKGKVDPGETLPQTAVREVKEETGLSVVLGQPLGITRYALASGRTKIVHYWAAEVGAGTLRDTDFRPNDEISGLRWVGIEKAKRLLSYAHDVDIVEAFQAQLDAGVSSTYSVSVLRHAKAVSPGSWNGADAGRPLTPRGRAQAEAIVPTLSAFGVARINASDAVRCQQTVLPLSAAARTAVKAVPVLSQDAYEDGEGDLAAVAETRVRTARNAVVCSHGPVIPAFLAELALASGSPRGSYLSSAAILDTSAFSVVHLDSRTDGAGIVAVETYPPRA
ncbi:NUDIX hydrolase [Mycetocola reblochoni]|uniref:MutT1 n=2 Tax=Mycetocola reblochoni TaxID=331618 RepID=A0A1R4JQX6_9MICO|nr:NUDIX domain-containing protein [Mycetocola reblochoni]RLP69297.1 NUDIX hydrolase [Mycetocola reblochoni]SJN34382.1 MutT1 [Mycetocola reblochoni REB411]